MITEAIIAKVMMPEVMIAKVMVTVMRATVTATIIIAPISFSRDDLKKALVWITYRGGISPGDPSTSTLVIFIEEVCGRDVPLFHRATSIFEFSSETF